MMGYGMGGGMGGGMMGGMMGGPGTQGQNLVMSAAQELSPEVAADPRGFMLRCALPGQMIGKLMGQNDASAKEVQDFTGAKISVSGNPSEPTKILSIEGPLLKVCAAYMMMMVRYINAEQEGSDGPQGGGNSGCGGQVMTSPFTGMC